MLEKVRKSMSAFAEVLKARRRQEDKKPPTTAEDHQPNNKKEAITRLQKSIKVLKRLS